MVGINSENSAKMIWDENSRIVYQSNSPFIGCRKEVFVAPFPSVRPNGE